MSIDRVPPQSHEAESAFLGGCLIDHDAVGVGIDLGLKREDFYTSENGAIWGAMVKLFDGRKRVDVVTVFESLKDDRSLSADFQPGSYLSGLAYETPTSLHAANYAAIIKEKSLRRGLIDAAYKISTIAHTDTGDIEAVLDKAEAALKRTLDQTPFVGRDPSPTDIIDRMESSKSSGIPTRIPYLNSISTGMVRGHIWVIGGFSSTGKTAFGVNLLEDVVLSGASAMLASTEMSQEQYMLRALSLTSGVPQRVIRHGGMNMEESLSYGRARDLWRGSKVRIFDDLYNVTRIRRMAKKVKEAQGLDVLFVDFIQNLNETGDEVKDARIAAIQLQQLAKDLDICVVALSQISNAQAMQQQETGAMGNYYAFKGSGAIKDAADLAIMLDRDRVNKPDVMWCNVVKNRHDSMGRVALRFHLETGEVSQMSEDEMLDADPNSGRKSARRTKAQEAEDG